MIKIHEKMLIIDKKWLKVWKKLLKWIKSAKSLFIITNKMLKNWWKFTWNMKKNVGKHQNLGKKLIWMKKKEKKLIDNHE